MNNDYTGPVERIEEARRRIKREALRTIIAVAAGAIFLLLVECFRK